VVRERWCWPICACADVWGHCILAMLEEDPLTWRAVNPRAWIKQTGYFELDFQPSLDAFAKQRVTTRSEIPASLPCSPEPSVVESSRGFVIINRIASLVGQKT
jgi:hypothetical protein